MKTTFIYGLKDPETNEIRYVGKANNPRSRFTRHLRDKSKTYKVNWINKLKSKNLIPELIIIEEVSFDIWQEREKHYIKLFSHLTNLTEGGECGSQGYKHTEETKRFFREERKSGFRKGCKHSKNTRKLLSQQRKGKRKGEENSFYGKHHSEKTLKILSQKGKERWVKGITKRPPIMIGKDNPSSKKRILIDPTGKEHIVYSLRKFCEEHMLAVQILKRNINKGKIQAPVKKEDLDRQRYKSKNTIGWEIKQ